MLNRIFGLVRVARLLKFERDATIDVDSGLATAVAGAATLHRMAGVVTSEALVTASGADYTLTLTNNKIAAGDLVLVTLDNGTNTIGPVTVNRITPSAGQVVILCRNSNAGALNGTIKIGFVSFKK